MLTLLDRAIAGRRVHIVATERSDGDVHPERVAPDLLRARQRAITGTSWTMLDQVHGTDLVDVRADDRRSPQPSRAGRSMQSDQTMQSMRTMQPVPAVESEQVPTLAGVGDVLRTDDVGTSLAVWAGDCATIFLVSDDGRLVGAHGGWRGLAAGVVDVAVDALDGASVVAAVLGPVIHPCCYEFDERDRRAVEAGVGVVDGALRSTTTDGRPALDVPAAVTAALGRRGVTLDVVGPCTGCDRRWFSHRIRRDTGRHATIATMDVLA